MGNTSSTANASTPLERVKNLRSTVHRTILNLQQEVENINICLRAINHALQDTENPQQLTDLMEQVVVLRETIDDLDIFYQRSKREVINQASVITRCKADIDILSNKLLDFYAIRQQQLRNDGAILNPNNQYRQTNLFPDSLRPRPSRNIEYSGTLNISVRSAINEIDSLNF